MRVWQLVREECRNIGHGLIMFRPDSEAELTILRSTLSVEMKMIAGDAVVQLLDIFKELELKLETTGLSLSHCSALRVSGAVAERCPALQEDPVTIIEDSIFTNISEHCFS